MFGAFLFFTHSSQICAMMSGGGKAARNDTDELSHVEKQLDNISTNCFPGAERNIGISGKIATRRPYQLDKVENQLQTISQNCLPGADINIGISGEITTCSFRNLIKALSGEEKMKDMLSNEHGFLSLGSAVGVDIALASYYHDKRLSVGIELQAMNVYYGKHLLVSQVPGLCERFELIHMDLLALNTFDPFDIIYCNSKG